MVYLAQRILCQIRTGVVVLAVVVFLPRSCGAFVVPPVTGRVEESFRQKAPFTAGRSPDDGLTVFAVIPEAAQNLLVPETADTATADVLTATVSGLDDSTTILIFLVGLLPFAVATVEFWRRIRFGEAFGTGKDSVVFTTDVSIGEDDAPLSSRGSRVLGQGALIMAVILFAVAAAVIGLAVVSVVTSPPSPPSF